MKFGHRTIDHRTIDHWAFDYNRTSSKCIKTTLRFQMVIKRYLKW